MTTTHSTRFFEPANLLPIVTVGLLCTLFWTVQRYHHATEKSTSLEIILTTFANSSEEQAAQKFNEGDFAQAVALLETTRSSPAVSISALQLRARALECLGRFAEAAQVYARLETLPSNRPANVRARKFCTRMASERRSETLSRPVLYRLHDELMQRDDAPTARFIARCLLPDAEPLRQSITALMRNSDGEVRIEPSAEEGRVDVTVRTLNTHVLGLLADLKIGALNVSHTAVDSATVLAGLDVRSLDLSFNGLSDVSSLRAMSLRSLQLNHTRTADVRPLAGMPLTELNLAHTMVTSLQPLSVCPLEKLNLASTPIRSLDALRGLELRELDLSRTKVADLSPLAGMPLERLNLTGCASVHDLRPIAGAKLKSLAISGTAIKDLDVIAGMPLVELDLRGCEMLADLSILRNCPRLERIVLPRHLRAPADYWGLPRLKFVESDSRPQTLALK